MSPRAQKPRVPEPEPTDESARADISRLAHALNCDDRGEAVVKAVRALQAKFERQDDEIEDLKGQVSKLEDQVEDAKEDLEAHLEAHDSDAQTLRDRVDQLLLRSKVSPHQARMFLSPDGIDEVIIDRTLRELQS